MEGKKLNLTLNAYTPEFESSTLHNLQASEDEPSLSYTNKIFGSSGIEPWGDFEQPLNSLYKKLHPVSTVHKACQRPLSVIGHRRYSAIGKLPKPIKQVSVAQCTVANISNTTINLSDKFKPSASTSDYGTMPLYIKSLKCSLDSHNIISIVRNIKQDIKKNMTILLNSEYFMAKKKKASNLHTWKRPVSVCRNSLYAEIEKQYKCKAKQHLAISPLRSRASNGIHSRENHDVVYNGDKMKRYNHYFGMYHHKITNVL